MNFDICICLWNNNNYYYNNKENEYMQWTYPKSPLCNSSLNLKNKTSVPKIKNIVKNRCWWECQGKGNFAHY